MATKEEIQNRKVIDYCKHPSVRFANTLMNHRIETIYDLTKIKNEDDFLGGLIGVGDRWVFSELEDILKSMNLKFGMTDQMWDEWAKNNL